MVRPNCGPNQFLVPTGLTAPYCAIGVPHYIEPYYCRSENEPKNLGKPDCGTGAGNPINSATGNKYQLEADYVGAGPFPPKLLRHYNSQDMGAHGPFGTGWRGDFQRSIVFDSGGSVPVALAYRADGKVYTFKTLAFTGDPDVPDRLFRDMDGNGQVLGWRYITATDETESYDPSGRLLAIASRQGLTLTLNYNGQGQLASVVDAFGRQLSFAYDSAGRVSTMLDPAGGAYHYAYDAQDRLTSVTFPDGPSKGYLYNEEAYAGDTYSTFALTGIVDENGSRYAIFRYNDANRAVSSSHLAALGVEVDTYQVGPDLGSGGVTVIDPLNTSRTLQFANLFGSRKYASASQSFPACGNTSKTTSYNATTGWSAQTTDFNNILTTYQRNDPYGRLDLESQRVEAVNTPQERTITTTWHPTYRLPVTIVEPAPGGNKTTTLTYDTSGNLLQRSISAPKNDGTANTITRTWNWTYTTLGRVLTATDPNGKITTYTYFSNTDANLGKRGNVATITNAAGHVTQITAYDAHGRALSTNDPNGLVTTLTYDPRSRLTSRRVGVELTAYVYDGVGQLTKVTLPDTSYVQYTYDAAHRLTQLNDGLGNKILYTLDGMGNRVSESAYDPANNLARTRSRVYNALNQLYQDLGAQNQTTAYAYDSNFNLTSTTDPLTHQTTNSYDALNRLLQVVDPGSGVTKYAYDSANNLTRVTDANTNATTYNYDGLNNLITQVSPDTGTTTNAYDAAGNLLTKTDARGALATYSYDNLNRATQVLYTKSGSPNETHTFTYDVGANAKGRLTQVTDPAATTAWTYSSQGRVASKSQTVGSLTRSVSYGYNSAGQLTTVTTPSGQQLGYSYTNNRVAAITINGQALINSTATEPFGPLAYWLWGNGLKMYRDYDNDGRMTSWEFRNGTSVLRKDQSFDLGSRIIGIADPINATASQTYHYDVLDRLTVAQTGNPVTHTQQFTYDAVGNRLNVTLDGSSANLSYGNSNRLQTLIGTISAGYLNGATSLSYTYNNANRLVAIQSSGSPLASYAVSALGQRVSKMVGSVTTLFVYDEQGHLLGEYDGSGTLIEETVWLGDLPVATLRPTGAKGNPTPINVYYVHADHLGSPRAITRPSDNVLMWQWDNIDPFGANAANENPAGQGIFKYGLRFPGQYYDTETGTNYNYYRDYDPSIGRYEQSDPVGLRGGLNTYSYVMSMPVAKSDAMGLDPSDGSGFSTRYGNWCGRNWSGGHEGPIIPLDPLGPIDSVDNCCVAHDYCYAKYECDQCMSSSAKAEGKKGCDKVLVDCLDKLRGKPPTSWPMPPSGTGDKAYFFCQKAKWWFK
jgi:RHS repeat-associated protein